MSLHFIGAAPRSGRPTRIDHKIAAFAAAALAAAVPVDQAGANDLLVDPDSGLLSVSNCSSPGDCVSAGSDYVGSFNGTKILAGGITNGARDYYVLGNLDVGVTDRISVIPGSASTIGARFIVANNANLLGTVDFSAQGALGVAGGGTGGAGGAGGIGQRPFLSGMIGGVGGAGGTGGAGGAGGSASKAFFWCFDLNLVLCGLDSSQWANANAYPAGGKQGTNGTPGGDGTTGAQGNSGALGGVGSHGLNNTARLFGNAAYGTGGGGGTTGAAGGGSGGGVGSQYGSSLYLNQRSATDFTASDNPASSYGGQTSHAGQNGGTGGTGADGNQGSSGQAATGMRPVTLEPGQVTLDSAVLVGGNGGNGGGGGGAGGQGGGGAGGGGAGGGGGGGGDQYCNYTCGILSGAGSEKSGHDGATGSNGGAGGTGGLGGNGSDGYAGGGGGGAFEITARGTITVGGLLNAAGASADPMTLQTWIGGDGAAGSRGSSGASAQSAPTSSSTFGAGGGSGAGGAGGVGGTGGQGGFAGFGGGGGGGTVKLFATQIVNDHGTIDVSGGGSSDPALTAGSNPVLASGTGASGNVYFGTNRASDEITLTSQALGQSYRIVSQTTGNSLGARALNPYVRDLALPGAPPDQHVATPYIPDTLSGAYAKYQAGAAVLPAGAEVYGSLNLTPEAFDAPDLAHVRSNAPRDAIAAVFLTPSFLGLSFTDSYALVFVNLQDEVLGKPQLAIGLDGDLPVQPGEVPWGELVPLMTGGYLTDPLTGGYGPQPLGALDAHGIFLTFVPQAAAVDALMFGSDFFTAGHVAVGGALYLLGNPRPAPVPLPPSLPLLACAWLMGMTRRRLAPRRTA